MGLDFDRYTSEGSGAEQVRGMRLTSHLNQQISRPKLPDLLRLTRQALNGLGDGEGGQLRDRILLVSGLH